ncbi:LIS1 homology motif containing protein [Cryptosporidium hominis]|uniref:LIS1 homology motif containing protein n=1 Tax=Cryptosporidium hominis TaxID=237895 RepID=A0ABX5BBB8_CRYHO|nr:LIS1 homology motif containing protein [Cryptosporidium hominis]|eukprot:PPS92962.1 LIS1 homology motif containing protein [Cryptosporidium hominis]
MQEDHSLEELRSAVKSELEKKGVLSEVRARLMAEILYSLTEENDENKDQENCISDENLILNSLIYDYLVYNDYQSTGKVLLKESKMDSDSTKGRSEYTNGKQILSNEELKNILRVEEKSDLPILYSLIK